jgi:hypothetical protein
VRVMEDLLKSGRAVCPKCNNILEPSPIDVPEVSAADTQMINIEEMARMAQEGVEMETSGEWDTSDPKAPEKKRNGKK